MDYQQALQEMIETTREFDGCRIYLDNGEITTIDPVGEAGGETHWACDMLRYDVYRTIVTICTAIISYLQQCGLTVELIEPIEEQDETDEI